MQVLIHMFSYSVLPPCLRHCAIHSRRYAGWSRGSSRSSFLASSFLSFYLPHSTRYRKGEDTRRASWQLDAGVVSGIQRGWFFLPAENVKTGGCLICGCSGLLYEILILEDIQQAYIRLACKSPPYLISRRCDALRE